MNSQKKFITLAAIGIMGVALFVALSNLGDGQKPVASQESRQTANIANLTADQNFKIEDITLGGGREVVAGTAVTMHYAGWLLDGTKFDSSYDRGVPMQSPIGFGHLIPGFEDGVKGMKEGGKRKITIPPSLGYGSSQVGPIPPNSTLIFEVEVIKVEGGPYAEEAQ